ncbi:MAG: heavy metal translocating P-type ATPase [Succiniclasticum sp.]
MEKKSCQTGCSCQEEPVRSNAFTRVPPAEEPELPAVPAEGKHQNHPHLSVSPHHEGYKHTVTVSHHQQGHPQSCRCNACEETEEVCDICGEDMAHCECRDQSRKDVTRVYTVENLDCSNCAARMEFKIKHLPGVSYAIVSYPKRQLRLTAKAPDRLLPLVQEICWSVDSTVRLIPCDADAAEAAVPETRTYDISGLDCAVCAQKVEDALNCVPDVGKAAVSFATGTLQVTAADWDGMTEKLQRAAAAAEAGCVLTPRPETVPSAADRKGTRLKASLLGSREDRLELAEIVAGGVLFAVTEWLGWIPEQYHLAVLVASYVILAHGIIATAGRNLLKGAVLDENFLMVIASLGAFAIHAWEEAVGVMFFYRIGEYFQNRAAERSRSQIMDAVDMRPDVVQLVRDDSVVTIPSASAKAGDLLLVRAGDRIPLDGIVVEGESELDTSPVTGESVPVPVRPGKEVLSGCVNTRGMLKLRVTKELSESMVTRILRSVENAAANKPHIDRFITRFARVYTPIVVGAAVLVAVVPSLVTGNWQHWVYTALTFLVISCPCALVLSVPLSFFAGIGAGSKLGILFKGGSALEQLTTVAAVVMDKTGTVTQGNFEVASLEPAAGLSEEELLRLAGGVEKVSTHPIARSIVRAAENQQLELTAPDRFEEIAGCGIAAHYGSDILLLGNEKLLAQYHVTFPESGEPKAGTAVLAARNQQFLGTIRVRDALKRDAREAVEAIRKRGIVTVMLTGDGRQEAEAVAREVGIQEVRAELMPQDKLNEMTTVRNKYGPVLFVGDGINDAPVLAGSDVGAAMGSGADAALEAADVVFMNSEMNSIPRAFHIAQSVNSIAVQNIVFAIGVKVLILAAGIFGYANMWAAIFADTGVAALCVVNSCRILYKKF